MFPDTEALFQPHEGRKKEDEDESVSQSTAYAVVSWGLKPLGDDNMGGHDCFVPVITSQTQAKDRLQRTSLSKVGYRTVWEKAHGPAVDARVNGLQRLCSRPCISRGSGVGAAFLSCCHGHG